MFFRVRKIAWEANEGKLDAFEIELEVNLPFMKPQPPRDPQQLARLEALFEELPMLIATFDRDGRLLYLNRMGRRLLEREDDGPELEVSLSDLYSDPECERLVKTCLPHAVRHGVWKGDGQIVTRKGARVTVTQDVVVQARDDGTFQTFAVFARPMGPMERALDSTTVWLGFLHDLNNLLSPIIAYVSLVDLHVPDSSPAKRYVHQIQRAAERMRDLSNRAARGLRTLPVVRRPVVLAEIVREVVGWHRDEFPAHRFVVETPVSEASIQGDPIALQEVVMNLLRNAAEALPAEGGEVWIGLGTPAAGVLRLTVRDDGCGIAADDLERIFEPFFSTKAGGSGLGLAVIREIVHRHDGTIAVDTSPGSGTTVHVDFRL